MRLIDADAVPKEFWEYEFDGKWRGCTIKDLLDSQPTIQPALHWIPVEQDTPTVDDDYWCTFDAETGRFVDWCSWYQGRWVVWTDDTVSEVSNVIAWCKSMEPYKGVTDGDD